MLLEANHSYLYKISCQVLLAKSNFLDNLKILHHSKVMSFDHPKTLQILFKDTFFLFPIITSYNEINIKFDLSFTVTVSVLCPLIILQYYVP